MRRKIIAVIGDSKIEPNSNEYNLCFKLGKELIENGYRIQTGGLLGVMEAVLKGAKSSKKYKEGDTIAIVPSFNKNQANEYADIVIPTGLDVLRNAIVVNADAVIALGGGAGTLSEMAIAWSLFKLIIAYGNVNGWSSKLAGTKLDNRIRYEGIDDMIYPTYSEIETIDLLAKHLEQYNRVHKGIK